jgi:N6-L-threonylcarbamoyladenine synthase
MSWSDASPTMHHKEMKEKLRILSIETSCDETAVSIIDAEGGVDTPIFKVLGNALYSQIDLHAEYGGVFPMLAKREHGKNLVPLLDQAVEMALKSAGVIDSSANSTGITEQTDIITNILEKEQGLSETLLKYLEENINKLSSLNIDYIAVTKGPGLEPALWVGISFAKALAIAMQKPLIPINHMEGHIVSVLTDNTLNSAPSDAAEPKVNFPALALLISGGHTELVECKNWNEYKIIGHTVDDAIGEAFDKVARLIGIPYPGGPVISKLAKESRDQCATAEYEISHGNKPWTLPRPMIHSKDLNFSFSGIKTAVLYAVREKTAQSQDSELSDIDKKTLAEEFENAVTEVIIKKTEKALEQTHAETLIIGGGVIANTYIRNELKKMIAEKFSHVSLLIPTLDMTTDNSVMIGIAGYLKAISKPENTIAYHDLEELNALGAKGGLGLED